MFKLRCKKLHPDAKLPTRAHDTDLGMDLYSLEDKALEPGEKYNFHLGFAAELPERLLVKISYNLRRWDKNFITGEEKPYFIGVGAFFWDKSSVGEKEVKTLGGVLEGSYRGEWIVMLKNLSDKPFCVAKHQKIAQVVITPVFLCDSEWVDELPNTKRGENGFGSTGKQ
jgi:dUTP pyrophosphatase